MAGNDVKAGNDGYVKLNPLRQRECPFPDCTVIVERGASYSEDNSKWCDSWDSHVHTHCDGIQRILDQDGHSQYRCGCYCHSRVSRGDSDHQA